MALERVMGVLVLCEQMMKGPDCWTGQLVKG